MSNNQYAALDELLRTVEELKNKHINKSVDEVKSTVWSFAKYHDPSFFTDKKVKLKEMAGILQDVFDGKLLHVLINVTVRTGKSYLLTVFLAYWIGHRPTTPIMRIANTDELFVIFSKDLRTIVRSEKYRRIFPHVDLKKDDSGKDSWSITLAKQVTFFGGGMDGTITGKGAELCVIDDPVKGITEGKNDKRMDKIFDIYMSDIITRLDPNKETPIIILHTRWNKRDLSGRLEAEQGVASINGKLVDEKGKRYTGKWSKYLYPALTLDNVSFDEYIHPTHKLLEKRDEYLKSGQEDTWNLLYQQDVVLVDKKEKLFYEEYLRRFSRTVFDSIKTDINDLVYKGIIDPADSGSNNLAIFYFAKINSSYYILDVVYTDKELGNTVTDEEIIYKTNKWGVRKFLYEKDGMGNVFSKLFKLFLENLNMEISMKGFSSKNVNKIQRILANSSEIKNKCVFLVDAEQDEHYKRFFLDVTLFNKKNPDKNRLDAPDLLASLVMVSNGGNVMKTLLGK